MTKLSLLALDTEHHSKDLSFWGHWTGLWHQAKMSNVPTKCSALLIGEMTNTSVTHLIGRLTAVLQKRPQFVLKMTSKKNMEMFPQEGNIKINSHFVISNLQSTVMKIR